MKVKEPEVVIIEEKKSPIKAFFMLATAIAAVLVAIVVVYKFIENKLTPKVIDRVDLNGDGSADAIMLDTTGNGEVDTIVLTEGENKDDDAE